MKIEGHAHIFMDGMNYRKAVRTHKDGPREDVIRKHLMAYRDAGITWIRDGGDHYGACSLAENIAGEYGITYRIPVFAIHKNCHYGSIVGRGFDTIAEFEALVLEAASQGADFIKIMTTGILDFAAHGTITGSPLERAEICDMVACAHEQGFSVMSHTNSAAGVIDAAEAGVDSVEHGNFQNEESLAAMKEHGTIWVPTLVTVRNLLGDDRFPEDSIRSIMKSQTHAVQLAYDLQVITAPGSDAGAYRVGHGSGIRDEWESFRAILDGADGIQNWLERGEEELIRRF